jgi:hypothetical protein
MAKLFKILLRNIKFTWIYCLVPKFSKIGHDFESGGGKSHYDHENLQSFVLDHAKMVGHIYASSHGSAVNACISCHGP